ncbi:MAG: AAA family ATPase [Desulfobacterales bacterium]|nr:AAA family ATPase [Desulfobacterales bacterium]
MENNLSILSEAADLIQKYWNPSNKAIAAQYWMSQSGKSGFSPVCANKKNRAVGCELFLTQNSCKNCESKLYMSLNTSIIARHLSGEKRIGIYPIIDSNKTSWIAADLDNHDNMKDPVSDLKKLVDIAYVFQVKLFIFTSNSNQGCHVYIFFQESILASKARALMTALLQRAGINLNKKSSFDSIFPKQDYLQNSELGNLIALPWSGEAMTNRRATLYLKPNTLQICGDSFEENIEYFKEEIELLPESYVDKLLSEMQITVQKEVSAQETGNLNLDLSKVENNKLQYLIEICEFLRHCKNDAAILSEPEWYNMICILAHEYKGAELIHEFSKFYPKYSKNETDCKIIHAVNDLPGPITCQKIKESFACGKDCGVTCPIHLINKPNSTPEKNSATYECSYVSFLEIFEVELESKPIITNFLYEKDATLIHAKGGLGKSLLTTDIALKVASKDEFISNLAEPPQLWNKFLIPQTRSTLFIQSENSRISLHQRLKKMCQGTQEYVKGLKRIFSPLINEDVCIFGKWFNDQAFQSWLIEFITKLEEQEKLKIDIVVIDPLISFHNGDENDNQIMRATLDAINSVSYATKTTPIVIHHDNRNNDYRGASAIFDWARNIIGLKEEWIEEIQADTEGETKKVKTKCINVVHEKSNNFPMFEAFTLKANKYLTFAPVANTNCLSDAIVKRCQDVVRALMDTGETVVTNKKLIEQYMKMTNFSNTTARNHIKDAVDNEFICQSSDESIGKEYRYTLPKQ